MQVSEQRLLASELSRYANAAIERLTPWQSRIGAGVAVVSGDASLLALMAYVTAQLNIPFLPMDPALPEGQVMHLMEQAGVTLLISERDLPAVHRIDPTHLLGLAGLAVGPRSCLQRPADSLAWIIATSGSEGMPKGVMLTAGNLQAAAQASLVATPLGPGDRWLACLPLFHIGGLSILARCDAAGAEAVLCSPFALARVRAELATGGITHLSVVPTMLAQLIQDETPPPASLRHVLVGGAALSEALAQQASTLGWPIQPTYGMSETAAQVATLPRLPTDWQQGQVGPAVAGLEIRCDAAGRIGIRGPSVMAGYANPARERGHGLADGWFITEDLGEMDATGQLTVKGRRDDVVVTGGKKIQPIQVESLLNACPGLREVAILGIPDPLWGERLALAYTGDWSESAILDWCRAHLSGAYRPRFALRLSSLPLLSNGKLDRKTLRERLCLAASQTGDGR